MCKTKAKEITGKEDEICELKTNLRKKLKHNRAQLSEDYRIESNEKILRNILQLPEYQHAKTIFCYVGTTEEIDTSPLIQHALSSGKSVAVPKCIGRGIMEAYQIYSLEELRSGYNGILEPDEQCSNIVTPDEIELVIVPCLSANRKGQRIGYGGGYYDRYLERTEACRVLLCREKLMYEDIPIEEHDKAMNFVISEEQIIILSF